MSKMLNAVAMAAGMLALLAPGVAAQTAVLVTLTAQSSLTTPLILYNVGYQSAVSAPLNLGSDGGRFNLIPLQTALTDSSSQLVFSAASCSSFNAQSCSFSSPTQLVAPLISINLLADTNCHFDGWGGIGSTRAGQTVISACDGYAGTSDVWIFVPNGNAINSFMIQAWNVVNGAYCMTPSSTATNQAFVMEACNPSDNNQLWQLYQKSA